MTDILSGLGANAPTPLPATLADVLIASRSAATTASEQAALAIGAKNDVFDARGAVADNVALAAQHLADVIEVQGAINDAKDVVLAAHTQVAQDKSDVHDLVALAAGHESDALAAVDIASSARDLASGYKNTTQGLLDSVSALALQVAGNKTSAEAAAASASAVSGLANLGAGSRALKTTATAVCVAFDDASRWTDGGAARSKIAHTSIMTEALNTATRGARQMYPARAELIGETATITITDADDSAQPLWKAWNVAGLTSVAALSGAIYYGGTGGFYEIDLILDIVRKRDTSGLWLCTNQTPATYNQTTATWVLISASGAIINATVNDISAAVTPLTPLNPLRCGLPNPTVAVGTMGGVSVIRADGAVANVTNTNASYTSAWRVNLTPDLLTFAMDGAGSVSGRYLFSIPVPAASRTVSWAVGSPDAVSGTALWGAVTPTPLYVGSNSNVGVSSLAAAGNARLFMGSTLGLSIQRRDVANAANSAIAYVATSYSSGYMAGGTKIALAESSAALANMVGGVATNRFGAGNNANVIGTLTRSVVAPGADLAAYGGFSAANYMEVPYNAAFDPASGDVQVMAEVVVTAALTKQVTLIDRIAATGGAFYRLDTDASGKPQFTISDGVNSAIATSGVALPAGAHCVRGIRRSGSARIELEVDGVIVATASAAAVGSLNNATAVLRIGLSVVGANPMDVAGPGIARVQVALSAPTPDQIATMWSAHAPQYAANAKILLAGSTIVQALAYDADTDQLAVATAAGTNLFKGLVRVGLVNMAGVNDNAKLSSDNHKAVAFSGGDLILASAAQVFGSLLATSGLRETAKKRAVVPAYDPTFGTFSGVTTDATPLDLSQVPVAEGRMVRFRVAVTAQAYGGAMAERGAYIVEGKAYRAFGGNVAVSSVTTTISETTATMDVAAVSNTTPQALSIRVTGKAATRMIWSAQVEIYDVAAAA